VEDSESAFERMPEGMRRAIEAVLEPGERILEVWSTRGPGANALVCAADRALISKRTDLIHWSVGAFPYSELRAAEMLDGRPLAAVQVELAPRDPGPRDPGPFEDFPDAYYQESRRLVAANTVMFRSRRRAREAVAILEDLIARHRSR
jgi:hypothetical protein